MALDNFINNKNFVLIFLDYLLLYQMKKIDSLCSKIDLINHSNKIYIITYYNTIYRCLMRHIIFDKSNLE